MIEHMDPGVLKFVSVVDAVIRSQLSTCILHYLWNINCIAIELRESCSFGVIYSFLLMLLVKLLTKARRVRMFRSITQSHCQEPVGPATDACNSMDVVHYIQPINVLDPFPLDELVPQISKVFDLLMQLVYLKPAIHAGGIVIFSCTFPRT
jgi:hypothetical protein